MVSVSGSVGAVLAGHQVAARLSGWHLTLEPGRVYTLTGTAQAPDPFWLQHDPLSVRVDTGTRERWTWAEATVEIEGGRVVARMRGRPSVTRTAE